MMIPKESGTPPPATVVDPASDQTLRSAWIHLLQYDVAANEQKYNHVRIRTVVLMLAFLTSFISVVFSSTTIIASLLNAVLGAGLTEAVRFFLFLFPLISTAIMAYATQFVPSQSWAKYRYSAEMIRRAIFLYRTQSGPYYEQTESEKKRLLSKAVKDADTFSGLNITTDKLPLPDNDELIKKIQEASLDKKGFGKLDFGTYVKDRLIEQQKWYQQKSYGDYRKMQKWQQYTLVIAAAGSLLTFLHFEAWVAVTTTAVFTVTALATLMMYGRTYNIYLKAAQELEEHLRDWNIKDSPYHDDLKNQSDFIQKSESIFGAEIDIWMNQTLDLLSQSEKSILQVAGASSQNNNSPSASPVKSLPVNTDDVEPPPTPPLVDPKNDPAILEVPVTEDPSLNNGNIPNGSKKNIPEPK